MKRRLVAALLSVMLVIGMMPVSALAGDSDPGPKNQQVLYVSENGSDSNEGTRDNPLKTLAQAVYKIDHDTTATIVVMSDLTMTESARYWDNKDITIVSDPESQTVYSISRDTTFAATQDMARGGYNGAMIEVGNGADLTLENIILDDGGHAAYTASDGGTPYFIQVDASRGGNPAGEPQPGYTNVNGEEVDNHKIVQDAIIASYDANSTITLGKGAELRNYGGMSAVRASGATLIMKDGSKICDTMELTRTKGEEGSLGPTGAVWVQNGKLIMEDGSEILGIDGRAVYADQGTVNVDGTISNLTYNANFQNAFQGLAVHLRGGANGEVSGVVSDLGYPDIRNSSSALHVVDAGTLTVSGKVHGINITKGDNAGKSSVVNGEGINTKVNISGEIYDITAETKKNYVLRLSGAAEGTLTHTGKIYQVTGNVVYLCDTSGEAGIGDTIPGKFTMESGSEISSIQGKAIYAEVWRDSPTMPSTKNPIPPENRDHVTIVIDGNIHDMTCTDHLIHMNADVNAFSEFANTPGEYADCTIGSNARIYNNEVGAVFGGQGGTYYVSGKIYENTGNVYTGYSNCGGALIYLQDQAEIYNNHVKTGTVFSLGNAKLIMNEGSSIHDNDGSGTASVIHAGTSGQFVLDGGKIYNNSTTAENGGVISYAPNASYSDIYDSRVQFLSGEVVNNTSGGVYDFIVAGSGAPSFISAQSERTLQIPADTITEDIDVYYQQTTHQDKDTKKTVVDFYGKSMTVDPGTKLGLISKDKTESGNVISGSLTALQAAATNYGLAAPFATFWAYNEVGTPVSIKMDAAQADQPTTPTLDPAKPVYVLIQKTDETGYPAAGEAVSLQAATVDADGTIHFDLTTDATGASIALAQPADANGALTLSTTVTELQEGKTPYNVPYEVKFDLGKGGISADAIRSAEVTFYSTNGEWNNHKIELSKDTLTGNWTATLDEGDFQPNKIITTSAVLRITTDTGTYTFYSNAADTKMAGGSLTITPADITVYTGGEGYTGVVDSAGQTTTTQNGLPEPGYYVTLPNWINEQLGGNDHAVDLSEILTLTYADGSTTREWKLQLYGTDAHSTDVAGEDRARYIYRLLPGVDENNNKVPIRLQLKDGDTVITSDKFTPDLDEQYKQYEMSIYSGGLDTSKIIAQIKVGGQTETCTVASDSGTLVVRGLQNEETTTPIAQDKNGISSSNISAVAPDNVTYYVNGSNVEVKDATGVKLLVDDVLSDGVLGEYIQDNMTTDIPAGNYTYAEKYLDLVDTKNGNAYLTLRDGQKMTMYWPVPVNMDTDKDFYVVHFDALDRNYSSMNDELMKNSPDVVGGSELVTVNGKQYVTFETGSFSPFVLVYEQKASTGGGGTTSYTITASAGAGGSIDPSGKVSVTAGSDKKFTITPADGYVIADVLVDGKSVGAVSSYTFEKVKASHTISASFEKELVVVDPDETGVSAWLNTKDHKSYLDGYPDGTFKPGQNMTRAEAAQMFYNLLLDQDVAITAAFNDVAEDAWYAKAVNTLASIGMINGVSDDRYEPDRSITRAEFTAIAMRFAKLLTGGENIFSDVTESDWFYDVVVGSIQYGWINGYSDGTFRPNATITRAEVTAITNRMLGRSADTAYVDEHIDELRLFPDVEKSHWAYYPIVEATNAHDYQKNGMDEQWKGLL